MTLTEKLNEWENQKSHLFVTTDNMTKEEVDIAILESKINNLENKLEYALMVINGFLLDIENKSAI